jgi:hypothetical protein
VGHLQPVGPVGDAASGAGGGRRGGRGGHGGGHAGDAIGARVAGAGREVDPVLLAHRGAIAALASKADEFPFEGRIYRLVPGAEWARMQGGERYQVIPAADAKAMLTRMASAALAPAAQKAALKQAATLVHDDGGKPVEKRLLLLRRMPARAATAASSAATITPSQLRKMLVKEDHWIEIEMVDDAGKPVADVAYVITTPDGREETGRTDAEGVARVTDIAAGQCKVRFPELDKEAWTVSG